ncbi:hypothetical protein BC941DRAFT_410423 [Chlamydoabsidia padenii]|nr:hypothetical protein BC941DRAFT_410423 [Chlamydoabsidia padenii]
MTYKLPDPVDNPPHTLVLEPYLANEHLEHIYTNTTHDDGSQVIIAHQDNDDPSSVVVYQAFSDTIADYAVEHQSFVGAPGYKLNRMTWIKPSFLWMQYRSGWNTKDDRQTRTLAIRLTRSFFDTLVHTAVISHFSRSTYNNRTEWESARDTSCVVVQWDPQYTPAMERVEAKRRAIQLGLKGPAAARLAQGKGVLSIEDITPFVKEMRARLEVDKDKIGQDRFANLWVPRERPYLVDNQQGTNLGADIEAPPEQVGLSSYISIDDP